MLYFELIYMGGEEIRDGSSDVIVSFLDKDNKILFLIVSNFGVSEKVWRGIV